MNIPEEISQSVQFFCFANKRYGFVIRGVVLLDFLNACNLLSLVTLFFVSLISLR